MIPATNAFIESRMLAKQHPLARARAQEHFDSRTGSLFLMQETGCQHLAYSADCPRHKDCLREALPVIQRSRTLIMTAFTAGGLLGALPAHADSVSVITGSLGGTSDFVFRGLSLTRGKPAAQASLDVEFPKEFYVGAFVATTDPNPGPSPRDRQKSRMPS